MLSPLVVVVSCEVDRESVGLSVCDGIASSLEITVASPSGETCMVARIEVLSFVVLVGISQTCCEAQVVSGSVLEVEVLDHLRIFREVLCSDGGVVEWVVVSGCASVGAR